jgi:GntR family transcriptional regulator
VSQTIERVSPIPYYEQLFDILKGRILNGDFAVDGRLPSELELCREFGLARHTVRQTLSKLESDGFARRVPRRGFFTSAPEETSGWSLQDPQGFLELQLRHGRHGVETNVVDARFLVPPPHVAEALRVGPDEEVFAIERVRSMNGHIAMFSTNWFPDSVGRTVSAAQDVLDGTGSVNSTLRSAGFLTSGAHRVVEALHAPDRVAEHLQIESDRPVLRVRSLSWDQSDTRFDYYETWVLTDVVPLEVDVTTS